MVGKRGSTGGGGQSKKAAAAVCKAIGCEKRACGARVSWCDEHKGVTKCVVCQSGRANYNYASLGARYCMKDRLPGMVNSAMSYCDECTTIANWNYPGEKRGAKCATHHLEGMVDLKNKTCAEPGCEVQPGYGYDAKKPLFCVAHKAPDMRNVISKMCGAKGCKKQASFGPAGTKEKLTCEDHAGPGYANNITARCATEGCTKLAYYFIPGTTTRFCIDHKGEEMDRIVKKCRAAGCKERAMFNFAHIQEEEGSLFCTVHKEERMINTEHKLCEHGGTRASRCLGSVCGVNLSGRSKEEVFVMAATYLALDSIDTTDYDHFEAALMKTVAIGGIAVNPDAVFGNIVVEYDGKFFHASAGSYERDRAKTISLIDSGYTVIRYRNRLDDINVEGCISIPLDYTSDEGRDGIEEMCRAIVEARMAIADEGWAQMWSRIDALARKFILTHGA